MKDYPKIQTLFKRDKKHRIIETQITTPELEFLQNNKWECTEKVDGTNVHIIYDQQNYSDCICVCGKTKNSILPKPLNDFLTSVFTKEKFEEVFCERLAFSTVSIFGEGYGENIQNPQRYLKGKVGFILFDVRINGLWLNRESCEDIAKKFNVPIVPIVGYKTIPEAIEMVRTGIISQVAEEDNVQAEGLVLRTPTGLLDRRGERIITKIKTKDFQ